MLSCHVYIGLRNGIADQIEENIESYGHINLIKLKSGLYIYPYFDPEYKYLENGDMMIVKTGYIIPKYIIYQSFYQRWPSYDKKIIVDDKTFYHFLYLISIGKNIEDDLKYKAIYRNHKIFLDSMGSLNLSVSSDSSDSLKPSIFTYILIFVILIILIIIFIIIINKIFKGNRNAK